MRILFVNNHCLSDPTAGVTQSFRTILRWWKEAGHAVTAVTTATFESPVPWTIDEHLETVAPEAATDGTSWLYMLDGVPVRLFRTVEDAFRAKAEIFNGATPDVIIVQGSHPLLRRWLADARRLRVTTVMTVRSFRYYDPAFYRDVDHVFTPSVFLQRHYQEKIQRTFDVLPPPLDWRTVRAASWDPKYVTFIQPRKHKGWHAIQRLAQMLYDRRPEILLRVVISGYGHGPELEALNTIAMNVKFIPPTATPAEWCAWTKILLVPSVWEEPWGRVAAEAMANGIVPIVSNRGALSEVVGAAGIVRRLPDWLLAASGRLPTELEMLPWFDTIVRLWDSPDAYLERSDRCRRYAAEHYSETISRQQYADYLQRISSAAR